MTSRRSEDNATTADWRSEKDGLYFDSTWSADSQGRKQPASTQITVTPSASILETSRAAQAANRERLDRRENEAKTEAEAVQKIKREEAEQKANKKEVTRGVPENKIRTVLPKRKFGGFGWIVQEHLGEFHDNPTTILDTTDVVFGSSKLQKTLFQQYRLYTPLIYFQPFALPAQYTTYPVVPTKESSDPPPIKCTVLSETKNSVVIRVHGEIESPGTPSSQVTTVTRTETLGPTIPGWSGTTTTGNEFNNTQTVRVRIETGVSGFSIHRETVTHAVKPQPQESPNQKYFFQVGVFFGKSSISKPSYVYVFHKKDSDENSPSLFNSGVLLSELSASTTYPVASIVNPDNLNKISIDVTEITPANKLAMQSNLKDIFGNDVDSRTFEYNRVGNITFSAGPVSSTYLGETTEETIYNTSQYYKYVESQSQFVQISAAEYAAIINSGTGVPYRLQNFQTVTTVTYTAVPKTFDETVEIIMVAQDYGPLE